MNDIIQIISQNEHGKSYKNAIKCPKCGYEIIGLSKVLNFINKETIFDDYQYDDYECPDCECIFSFNTQNMEMGDYLENSEGLKKILSTEIWVWSDYQHPELLESRG